MSKVKTTLLYDQHSMAEESSFILSSMYTFQWTYPGASNSTTTRCRLTCVYTRESNGKLYINLGLIEKWGSDGWVPVDEYCDDRENFSDIYEFRKRLVTHAQSFFSGEPLTVVDNDYTPEPDFALDPEPNDTKSGLRVINFSEKKEGKASAADKNKEDKPGWCNG